MLNENYVKHFRDKFEGILNDGDLAKRLIEHDSTLKEIIEDDIIRKQLIEGGFPADVDLKEIDYDLKVTSKQNAESLAESFVGDMDIETADEFQAYKDDDDTLLTYAGQVENLDFELTIKTEVQEAVNLDAETFAGVIKESIDYNTLLDEYGNSDTFTEAVNEKIIEEDGRFSEIINEFEEGTDFTVSLKNEFDADKFSKEFIDSVNKAANIDDYMDNQFYKDAVDGDYVYDLLEVNVLSEYEEMTEERYDGLSDWERNM